MASRDRPLLVVLDMALTTGDTSPEPGFRLLEWMGRERLLRPDRCQVTVVSAHLGDYTDALRAIGVGANEVVSKPVRAEIDLLPKLLEQNRRAARYCGQEHVIASDKMWRVEELARRAGESGHHVIIYGEPGTGKAHVARVVHRESQRRDGTLVMCDGSASAADAGLLLRDVFGAARSEESAGRAEDGAVSRAGDGYVLIDDLQKIPVAVQAPFSRYLRDGSFCKLGATDRTYSKARMIFTVNEPPQLLIDSGRLLSELYNLVPTTIVVPPLRERKEEMLPIARRALEERGRRLAISCGEWLRGLDYDWPQNVRELRRLMNNVDTATPQRRMEITIDDIVECIMEQPPGDRLKAVVAGGRRIRSTDEGEA